MTGGAGWFIGPVTMLLFLAAAVAVIVLMVRWLGGTDQSNTRTPLPIHPVHSVTHVSGCSAPAGWPRRRPRGKSAPTSATTGIG